jgi:hypothetical protein
MGRAKAVYSESSRRWAIAAAAILAGVTAQGAVAADAAPANASGGPPVTWAPAPNSIVNPSRNTALDAWEGYKGKLTRQSVDEGLADPVLKGAIDIHAHFGPDSYSRQWDAFEIARMAAGRGMRGLVLKNHWSEAAGIANLVHKHAGVPGLKVFGGLALNTTVGGINPQAVRYFAEIDGGHAKIVWMPSHDSEKEVLHLREDRPYVIVSSNGILLPSVLEVLDLVAQYKLTLATGHVAAAEMLQIVAEARKRGIDRIIITHPGLGAMYTDPTLDQLKQVISAGAFAEIVAAELYTKMRPQTIRLIRAIGAEHCIVASDSGLTGSPSHPDALVRAARVLREEGFSEHELTLMFKANPARVLGLPVLPEG